MAPIEWEQLSEDQHELLVLMLLNHLHPTFRRIDGSGGDGSRDVQFNGIDGLHIFQLKSLTGRLDARWRKQTSQRGAEEEELPRIASDARASISARVERTARFRPGERLRLGVEPGRVHVFDARSGMALTSPPVD